MKTQRTNLWWPALLGAGLAVTPFLRGRRTGPSPGLTGVSAPNTHGTIITQTNAGANTSLISTTANPYSAVSAAADALAAALAAIEGETNPSLQSATLVKLVDGMRMADLPAVLAALAEKSGRIPSELRQMLIHRGTNGDAPAAAEWVERNLSGAARAGALNSVAATWAESDAARRGTMGAALDGPRGTR